MKKLFLLFMLATIAMSGMAQTIGEAFYIYRNDGQFNAFFRDEVQSIEYSYYDADSVRYDEIVTQVVITADSIYKIPLAAIDSVAFVQPKTILRDDVTNLQNIAEYVISVQDTILFINKSIPQHLFPNVGSKLATTETNLPFPLGFAGKVAAVSEENEQYKITCKDLAPEDFYVSYCSEFRTLTSSETASASRRSNSGNIYKPYYLPEFSKEFSIMNFGFETSPQKSFEVKHTFGGTYKPKILIEGVDIVHPELGRLTSIDMNLLCDIENSFSFSVYGTHKQDVPFPKLNPLKFTPFLKAYFDVGFFAAMSGGICYEEHTSQQYTASLYYRRSGTSFPEITYKLPKIIKNEKEDTKLSLKGIFQGGIYAELGFKAKMFEEDDVNINIRLEGGIEAELEHGVEFNDLANANRSTKLYEALDFLGDMLLPHLTLSAYASLGINLKMGPIKVTFAEWKGKLGAPLYEGGFFPHFSDVSSKYISSTQSHRFSSWLSNECLFPYNIGFTLFDDDGNKIESKYFDDLYYSPAMLRSYYVDFGNLTAGKKYKVYPTIKAFGKFEILALPTIDVDPRQCPVIISSFEQTMSQYSKDAFINDGENYDFCFSTSVTASLEEADDIEDWGYVYEDLNGDTTHVSLKTFASPYTDTRYAYYRNEPKSHATLYGYVKYVGDETFYHGEKTNYPLIYDKQPVATTLEPTFVGQTSAKVRCSYKEVAPWGGTCGIEYWENDDISNSKKIYFETTQEEIEIPLNDLERGTDYHYRAIIMIGEEQLESEVVQSFKTKDFVVTVNKVTEKSQYTAKLTGQIEGYQEGLGYVYFNYKTDENSEVWADEKANYDEEHGLFFVNLTKLDPATTYYYRLLYVVYEKQYSSTPIENFQTDGFEVTTLDDKEVHYASATIWGRVADFDNFGGSVWFNYSTEENSLTPLEKKAERREGSNDFYQTLRHLKPNTTYYYRASYTVGGFMYDADNILSFTTNDVHVTTLGQESITPYSAVICGTIEDYDPTTGKVHFEYTTDANSENWAKKSAVYNEQTNVFSVELTGLEEETTYYYRFVYEIDGQPFHGLDESFQTTKFVFNIDVTEKTHTTAKLTGEIENYDWTKGDVHFYYATDKNSKIWNEIPTTYNSDSNKFSAELKDLAPAKKYFYKLIYTIDELVYESDICDFRTEGYGVTTLPCNSDEVTQTSAVIRGTIRDYHPEEGIAYIDYTTNPNNAAWDERNAIYDSEENVFHYEITGLEPSTTYYYRMVYSVNGEPYWGDTLSVTTKAINLCPDANHPHWIDLGLPSGTKWACCNVGANAPEEYGGYYDYGEITTAPSQKQIDELCFNATSQWITYHGVNGRIYLGSNGNAIFLPDAGYYWSDGSHWDQDGCYWSSTYVGKVEGVGPPLALELRFDNGMNGCCTKGCHEGGYIQSVRIVDDGIKITTGDATEIKSSSAILNGTVENLDQSSESVQFLFLYSTNKAILNTSDCKIVVATNNEGKLTAEVSSLDAATYYYSVAYKRDVDDYVLGVVKSFTTTVDVTTIENPEVTVVSATLQGTCSPGVTIAGFSIKKDGDTDYTQYEAYPDGDGNFSRTIDGLDIETQYVYYAFAKVDDQTFIGNEYSFTTKSLCPNNNHPHMIDLGLPSGVKWACCNVGASQPQGYGNYYAWGETLPKSYYAWTTYKYGTSEDGSPEYPDNTDFTKYCNNSEYGLNGFCDGKTTLDPSDDAATANWGNGWRMPLMREQKELVENCNWSMSSRGRLAIGPNGNAIFLPAAGFKYSFYPNDTGEAGRYGSYWSASIDTTVPANSCQAADMNFQNSQNDYLYMIEWRYYRGSRCAGESVRAVHN